MCCFCFFFFKQKTAYEMRISDWSSDVCSSDLRTIQQRVGITFIYITHDQGEALTMSDRIAVMSDGVVQQIDEGATVYDNPATSFVASFVGENNPFFGQFSRAANGFAVADSASGPLVGRPTHGPREGVKAIIFVRPDALVGGNAASRGRS